MAEATNLLGQVSSITDDISTLQWSYDEQGRVVSMVRELWDPLRSSEAEQQRDAFRVDFSLDPQGKVLASSLPGGLDLSVAYNPRSLVSRLDAKWGESPPLLTVSLQYNAQGGISRQDLGNGVATCNWYDARQRLFETLTGQLDANACASGAGTNGTGLRHVVYGFTSDGLIQSIVDKSAVVLDLPRLDADYAYDRLYELTTARTNNEGTLRYRYDTIQNLIAQESDVAVPILPFGDFAYGEGGAGPNQLTTAGGEHYAYDGVGRLVAYNGFGLGYDVQNRLVDARRADGTWIRNYYDFAGERILKISQLPGEAAKTYRYPFESYQQRDGQPTWVVSAGSSKVAEISQTPGLVPSLALLDQLVAYRLDSSRRPKPAAEELLDFDGDGSGVDAADLAVARERYWAGVATGVPVKVVRYYHKDQLGGPTHATDSVGDWISLTRFYPYGVARTRLGEQPIYGFAGGEREAEDELGLMRFGARWYAPRVGRWVSPDPLFLEDPKQVVGKPLAANLYGYVNNNPVNATDPDGLEPLGWDHQAAGGTVGDIGPAGTPADAAFRKAVGGSLLGLVAAPAVLAAASSAPVAAACGAVAGAASSAYAAAGSAVLTASVAAFQLGGRIASGVANVAGAVGTGIANAGERAWVAGASHAQRLVSAAGDLVMSGTQLGTSLSAKVGVEGGIAGVASFAAGVKVGYDTDFGSVPASGGGGPLGAAFDLGMDVGTVAAQAKQNVSDAWDALK